MSHAAITLLAGGSALLVVTGAAITIERRPWMLVPLIGVLGQILTVDAQGILPETFKTPAVVGIKLRYADAALVVATAAVMLRVARRLDRRGVLSTTLPLTVAFVVFTIVRMGFSVPSTGLVASAGEWRTYYGTVFLASAAYYLLDRPSDQYTALKAGAWFAALIGLLALVKGSVLYGLSIGPFSRWLSASALLAMFWLAYAGQQIADRTQARHIAGVALVAATFLLLTNVHRSVVLALLVVIALHVARMVRRARLAHLPRAVALATLAAGSAGGVMLAADVDVPGYYEERLTAFTKPSQDRNAYWRLFLWRNALIKAADRPVDGRGFGEHFQLEDPEDDLIMTSPHNLYISTFYHGGSIGLFLLIGALVEIATRFRWGRFSRVHWVGFSITAGASAYWIAYPFDYLSPLLVALLLRTAQSRSSQGAA